MRPWDLYATERFIRRHNEPRIEAAAGALIRNGLPLLFVVKALIEEVGHRARLIRKGARNVS